MIVTEFYDGQGLGNQLWCYVTARVLAADKNIPFGIQSREKFKGHRFLELDLGAPVAGGSGPEGGPPRDLPAGICHYYNERRINHPESGCDIRVTDPLLVAVPDNTKIDGIMQDEQTILHRRSDIRSWLPLRTGYGPTQYASDDVCVINFRGGEYVGEPSVFLNRAYWHNAIRHMRHINPRMRFIVVTDDVIAARLFFPTCPIRHFGIGGDYAAILHAHYLILSNSSFAWFPAWLNTRLHFCIAPQYWAHHNVSDGYWACGYNLTTGWHYLGRDGLLSNYHQCRQELANYTERRITYYRQPRLPDNTMLVVSNYYNDLSWITRYTHNYIVYDQGDTAVYSPYMNRAKVLKSEHLGHNIRDYMTYIVENYDNLPDRVLFATGNIFPRHISQQRFDRLATNTCFTPFEDPEKHSPRWPIAFFASDGGYCELNNSWYLAYHPTRYFHDYNDFLRYCFTDPIIPRYIRFAPGANYIVPREHILKLPKTFYQNLRVFVSHCSDAIPGESHIIERALHTLWTANFTVSHRMLTPVAIDSFMPAPPPRRQLLGRLRRRACRAAWKPVRALSRLTKYLTGE